MSKNKKFQPPAGFVVAVHMNMLAIKAVAAYLKETPIELALALEMAGFNLTPDIMDLSADAAKVLILQDKEDKENDE